MGVPLWPLGAAYGLATGHLAGVNFYNRWMRPTQTLQTYTHTTRRPAGPPPDRSIKDGSAPAVAKTSTAMAKRGRTYSRTQRRKRRGRFGRRRRFPARTITPFKMVRVLKTVKYVALNPGAAGAISVSTFMVNSGNDPTDTTGSGQPLGWDQLAGLYERYSVIGAKIVVEATSADATHPIALGIHANQYQTNLTTYEHYKEQPMTQMRLMTPEQDKIVLGMKFPISKFYGHRKFLTDERLSSLVTANPEDKVYCHLFAQPVDQATDTGAVHCVVTMYQTIVFFAPRVLARS